MTKSIVVYRELYLPHSETFIYEQITHLHRYKPYVLCRHKISESTQFPYPHVYCIQNISNLKTQILRKKVKLIYARFGMGGVQMLPVKMKLKLPMLTSFHGTDVSRQITLQTKYRKILPHLFKRGEAFTVVSQDMKNKLIELGCPMKKIHVIKSGIDLNKFHYEPKLELDPSGARILSVGRLIEKKGMAELISAFSRVASFLPRAKLVIVGDGKERESLERQIDLLGMKEQVELKGRLSHPAVKKEMERCDLFVLASRTGSDGNVEGIPNVIMEAMAIGRPVVTTRHAGIPELVEHNQTGYLVQEGDSLALAEMILYGLYDLDRRQQLLNAARKKVEEEHDVVKQIQKLERLMDKIIKKA